MSKSILSYAESVGRSFLRVAKRLDEIESTSHCAAAPRIPHRQ